MDINALKTQIESDLQAAVSWAQLQELRTKYLGRKGALSDLTAAIPTVPQHERADFGRQVNALKAAALDLFAKKEAEVNAGSAQQESAIYDDTMPGISREPGTLHLLTQVMDEITVIFERMGFVVEEGPEVETEFNNFTGLNIPLEHPSRDAFDTFYVQSSRGERLLLRSHTSPAQVSVMKSRKPPLAVIVPGRVYRPDAVDASHSFMFHQIEGFLVDKAIAFPHLKGILETFAKAVFGKDIRMRLRPHFFPFTEPSAEMDISCIICKGRGCSACGRKGWLEILGAGMIHPNVFKQVGYDAKKYSGFAFGMGVDRIAMLKYGINDIRIFFENDVRFLKQFRQ